MWNTIFLENLGSSVPCLNCQKLVMGFWEVLKLVGHHSFLARALSFLVSIVELKGQTISLLPQANFTDMEPKAREFENIAKGPCRLEAERLTK